MIVKGTGILRHGFFGTYCAAIGVEFSDWMTAHDALPVLGEGWKYREGNRVLTWNGERDALEALKERLASKIRIFPCAWKHCFDKCSTAGIDGVPHSIDYGPSFELTLDVTPSEQRSLFP